MATSGYQLQTSAGKLQILDNTDVVLGTTDASGTATLISYSTAQTPDATVFGLNSDSNILHICEYQDAGFDFQLARQSHPTIAFHSANQNTTEYGLIEHIGTRLEIVTGSGDISMRSASNVVAMHDAASSNKYVWNTGSGYTTAVNVAPLASVSQSPTVLLLTAPAHTLCTAATAVPDIKLNLGRNVQFASGTSIAFQNALEVYAPTYTFDAAASMDEATTMLIDKAPNAGANATIGTAIAFVVGDADGWTNNSDDCQGAYVTCPGIAVGVGAVSDRGGFGVGGGDGDVSLGNMTATLSRWQSSSIDIVNLTSDTNTRTVTQPVSFYIEGAPTAGSNVSFTNLSLAMHVDAGVSRFDDSVCVGIAQPGTSGVACLALGNAATPPIASTDAVNLYSKDLAAGSAMLGMRAEVDAVVAAAVASTHKIPIEYNGTTYYILATTVA